MYKYKNGNFTVAIYKDGTKIRETEEDEFIPDFSECCDVKITDNCSQGCKFCYEGCTKNGLHADLQKYDKLIDSMHPFTEMALNGNDLNIPNFNEFLIKLRNKRVIANITVNQNQFMDNYKYIKFLQDNDLIHGIGVSLIDSSNAEFINTIQKVKNVVIHTIAGIFSENDYENLKDKGLKILVLGYKKLRRGELFYEKEHKSIEDKIDWLSDHIIEYARHFDVVSFDNLSIHQLDMKSKVAPDKWEEMYMGDDGSFTFYIDLVEGKFAQNSLSTVRYDIGNKTIDEMFKIIRDNKK